MAHDPTDSNPFAIPPQPPRNQFSLQSLFVVTLYCAAFFTLVGGSQHLFRSWTDGRRLPGATGFLVTTIACWTLMLALLTHWRRTQALAVHVIPPVLLALIGGPIAMSTQALNYPEAARVTTLIFWIAGLLSFPLAAARWCFEVMAGSANPWVALSAHALSGVPSGLLLGLCCLGADPLSGILLGCLYTADQATREHTRWMNERLWGAPVGRVLRGAWVGALVVLLAWKAWWLRTSPQGRINLLSYQAGAGLALGGAALGILIAVLWSRRGRGDPQA